MLSPRYLAGCSDDIVQLYAQLESDIIRDMARRLSKMQSVTDATLWQAQILRETGSFTQNISKYLDKYNEQAKTLIQNLFNEAMTKAQQSDIAVLQNGLNSMSDNQKQALESLVQKTSSAGIVTGSKKVVQETAAGGAIKVFSGLQRLTMTIANTAQNDFIQQANNAYMQVVTGAFDYKTALKNSVNALAEKGIHTVEYTDSGKSIHRTIESAVRANILTGINQTASQQTRNNCAELGTDLVEVSAHMGAREEHAAWQGKVYSLSGGEEKYPSFNDICKPGTPGGIGGINCRHSYYPYFEGMELHYSNGELDEMREPKVTYNGKQITQYEAEQKLRGVERNIRKFKLKAVALEEAGLDNTAERRKIGEWQTAARDIVTQTGIRRDPSREYVGTKGGKQPTALKPEKATAGSPANSIPQTVINAKTVSEVEIAIRKENWFSTTVERRVYTPKGIITDIVTRDSNKLINLSGVDLESSKAVYKTYEKVFTKYPQLKGNFQEIASASLGRYTYAQSTRGSGRIEINKNFYENYKKLCESYEKDVKSGYHPVGTTADSIVIHEIGHSINSFLAKKTGKEFSAVAMEVRKETLKKCGFKNDKQIIKAGLSRYAVEGKSPPAEFFAEAFAEYMESKNPRIIAKAFGEVLKEWMK